MTAIKTSAHARQLNEAGVLPIAILALAFGLRAFAVGRPALRGDEGFSVALAAKPVREMVTLPMPLWLCASPRTVEAVELLAAARARVAPQVPRP